jgi:hypothetical protein
MAANGYRTHEFGDSMLLFRAARKAALKSARDANAWPRIQSKP